MTTLIPIDELRRLVAQGDDCQADRYDMMHQRVAHYELAMTILDATKGRARQASEERKLKTATDSIDLIDQIIDYATGENRRRTAYALRDTPEGRLAYPDTPTPNRGSLGGAIIDAIAEVRDGRTVSYVDIENRTLTEGGSGGYGVNNQLAVPVSNLKARSVVMGLPGVQIFAMKSDRVRWPRFGTATVGAATEGSTLTAAATDIDAVDVVAAKYGTLETLSTELEEDMEADALGAIGSNLLRQLALKVDLGLLEGLGASEAVGIRNVVGANSTSLAATPSNFVKFRTAEYELRLDNGEPVVWVMHPRSWSRLGDVKTGIASDETTLLEPNPQAGPRTLLGYPVAFSSQITLTEGAGAGSWAGLLDTSQIIVCERRPARLEVSRDVYFDSDRIAVRATWRGGLGVLNPEAISLVTDIR